MSVLLARYRVADPGRFRTVYDAFAATRAAHGARAHRLLASEADPARFVAVIEFDDAAAAELYAHSAARATALDEAGVVEREDEVMRLERAGGAGREVPA
ncbi:hypothetical protein [Miltoncostaea oceani]|jgi:antibiotic biosynthesis monooxygenase (ABM) superfamily enzyme|uniref:hypothetical protein n=1 Tax=Miltoncostaea oceani TaxID=2843216 RepID=UPI001C3CF048|nr:hypothetical protein [Miltoncostaea oceani]